jgi:hypothetical protein
LNCINIKKKVKGNKRAVTIAWTNKRIGEEILHERERDKSTKGKEER